MPREKIHELQLVSKTWYEELIPNCVDSSKVNFVMENIFKMPVFVQYYEGCLMWIDIASYVEN